MKKWIKIDSDSYGTILTSWCICAVLIFLTARYVPWLWLSIPLCAFMVIFMVFITWFFRVPNRETPYVDNHQLVTSVADGKVVIVDKVYEKEYLKRECIQISVYMDCLLFGARQNRIPRRPVRCHQIRLPHRPLCPCGSRCKSEGGR